MKVRCIGNSADYLESEQEIEAFEERVHMDEVHLVVGRDYTVFGVELYRGRPWFLVCEEPEDEYPKPHFGALFDLVDSRIPVGWSLTLAPSNLGDGVLLLPDEWARDPSFMERLVCGDPVAVTSFKEIKQRLL